MKKIFSILLATLLVFVTSACGSNSNTQQFGNGKEKGFVIGFANGYFGNTWRSQFVENIQKEAEKYKKDGTIKELKIANSNADVQQQLNQLNSMINAGVDALMINPVSAKSLGPVIAKAKAKNILVVITNDPAAYEGTYAVIGNNDAFWRIQAEWIAQKLNQKGNIVQINGLPGNTADQLRQEAAKDVLKKYPGIKILSSVPGKWDQSVAQQSMSTLLSTYNNIDGILMQDVMTEGVLRAYENAGKKPPIMTGDYTFGFLRKWQKMPDLESIAVSYAPGVSADALNVTVNLLKGKKIKEEVLQPNPLDKNLKNTIQIDPPYVVTKNKESNAPWLKGLKFTKAISLEEAIQLGKGKPDGASLDATLTQEQIDSFFE